MKANEIKKAAPTRVGKGLAKARGMRHIAKNHFMRAKKGKVMKDATYEGFEVYDDYIDIYMERDGFMRTQAIQPYTEEDVAQLEAGVNPIAEGWEDGNGNYIEWANAKPDALSEHEIESVARDLYDGGWRVKNMAQYKEDIMCAYDLLEEDAIKIGEWLERLEHSDNRWSSRKSLSKELDVIAECGGRCGGKGRRKWFAKEDEDEEGPSDDMYEDPDGKFGGRKVRRIKRRIVRAKKGMRKGSSDYVDWGGYEGINDLFIDIFMERNGEERVQTIQVNSQEEYRDLVSQLEAGINPIAEGWEDGNGHYIEWDYADEIEESSRKSTEPKEESNVLGELTDGDDVGNGPDVFDEKKAPLIDDVKKPASARKGSVTAHGGMQYDGKEKYFNSPMMQECINSVKEGLNARLDELAAKKCYKTNDAAKHRL